MTRGEWARRLGLAVGVMLATTMAIIGGTSPTVALRVGAYVIAAIVVESAMRLLRPTVPPRRSSFADIARRPRPRPAAPPKQFEEVQRIVWRAVGSIGGWHYRLRPVLREVADAVLEDRRGLRLDRDTEAVRGLLGERGWDLLRPGAAAPGDRWDDGVPAADLEDLVGRIEEL